MDEKPKLEVIIGGKRRFAPTDDNQPDLKVVGNENHPAKGKETIGETTKRLGAAGIIESVNVPKSDRSTHLSLVRKPPITSDDIPKNP
jgi:hypothetical protein